MPQDDQKCPRPACKPPSVRHEVSSFEDLSRLDDHLSRPECYHLAHAVYPEFKGGEQLPTCHKDRFYSCLTLLPTGVTWPPHYCKRRWSLTPPFHPYPFPGGIFLWPCSGRFPRPGCYPTLRSVEGGLSSICRAYCDHPTDLGRFHLNRLSHKRQRLCAGRSGWKMLAH